MRRRNLSDVELTFRVEPEPIASPDNQAVEAGSFSAFSSADSA